MKAWRFIATHKPFEKVEVEEPSAGPGQVKIDVKAAGLCHSDVGILEDEKWLANISGLPRIPGHEIAGVISEVGEGVADYAVGDRVAVCPMIERHGYDIDGGFGEQVVAKTDSLVRIPDGIPYELAAVATDAGMTSHGAVVGRGKVKAGERVGIIGVGGLGQIGARIAVLNGAEVYVAEINEAAWPVAEKLGAKKVVKDIGELKDEGLDVIVDFAGFGTTTASAISTVKYGGRVVQVGMGRLDSTINTYDLIIKRVDLLGNHGGTKEDIEAVLGWMAQGLLEPVVEMITFDGIAEGVDRLGRGEVRGRLVALYEG